MAAVWQNKRTGIFRFIGEHNGRPVYQNNATKEYLYYTFTGANIYFLIKCNLITKIKCKINKIKFLNVYLWNFDVYFNFN